MKKIFFLLLVLSSTAFAQTYFKVSDDKSLLRSLKNCKENHLIILKTYRKQIDSEIKRLATGIEIEHQRKAPKLALKLYDQLMIDLIIKRIFVTELEGQLRPLDLDTYYHVEKPKKVFNTDAIKIDLAKQVNVQLDQVLDKENNLGNYFLEDLKERLIHETVKEVAVKTYKAIGSGLLAKILIEGLSGTAIKTAVLSLGSEVFVSAGTGAVLTILTMPLQSYRLPPERIWTDILEDHPELILNPEWMRYAGSHDDPWMTHAYAILRRTDDMEEALTKFMNKEEAQFKREATSIYNIKDFSEKLKEEESRNELELFLKKPVIDNTRVYRPIILTEIIPYWVLKH